MPNQIKQQILIMIHASTISHHPGLYDLEGLADVRTDEDGLPGSASRRRYAAASKGVVVLPTMEGLCFEKAKHVTYLEANGNYTSLHFSDGRQILVCKTLCDVEQMLPAGAFARIHRSHTVHLRHLKKYVRGKGGYVVLQNGVTLTVSAGQKEFFLSSLKRYFG